MGQYLELSEDFLFITRDPHKHALSFAKAITKEPKTFLERINAVITGEECNNHSAAINWLSDNICQQRGMEWREYLKEVLNKQNDFSDLDPIFEELGYNSYDFSKAWRVFHQLCQAAKLSFSISGKAISS